MEIPQAWKQHSLYAKGAIELVPTEWLWQYWGTDVSDVDFDELWKDLCTNGMQDPLIMRIGTNNKKFRLEAGNHRIQLLHLHNVAFAPLTVQVKEECGPQAPDLMTDATHNFDFGNEVVLPLELKEYMKPSEIFTALS